MVIALQAVLLFVLLHECAVGDGVYVGRKLELFGWLLSSVGWATLTIRLGIIETGRHEASVAILNCLLGSVLLTLRQWRGQQFDLATELFLILVGLKSELLLEHLLLLPSLLALAPVEPFESKLQKDVEVKNNVLEEHWCPPDAILLCQVNIQLDKEAVEHKDGCEQHFQVRFDFKF